MRRRVAHLPLHDGKAPPWLFERMTRLAGAMTMAIVEEHGPEEMLRRLADPWWFQAFGCVLGFDWHSSGVTTVTCGALKEAFLRLGPDLGILVAGGKGKVSRRTPLEITQTAQHLALTSGDQLIYASRMSAKVDSAAVQDGFGLYHHSFFFTPAGAWCVVQQGMDTTPLAGGYARRYHWLGEHLNDFVCEPHTAVQDLLEMENSKSEIELNMVAEEAAPNRSASTELVRENPDRILKLILGQSRQPDLFAPAHHPVLPRDVNLPRLNKIVRTLHERQPRDFETLLGTPQVGARTIRSLALIAELIYEAPVSRRDIISSTKTPGARKWADYSYAHGGKDGTPFPVDRKVYDRNVEVLTDAVRKARLGENDKVDALRRLASVSAFDPKPTNRTAGRVNLL
jgi:uncharacterized protein